MLGHDVPKCSKCGYELTGLATQGTCPECGQVYNQATRRGLEGPGADLVRTERLMRRVRTIFLAGMAVVALMCGGVMQVYSFSGRALPVMGVFAVMLLLMALTSYLYEKD